jgi:urocanate hydratase
MATATNKSKVLSVKKVKVLKQTNKQEKQYVCKAILKCFHENFAAVAKQNNSVCVYGGGGAVHGGWHMLKSV